MLTVCIVFVTGRTDQTTASIHKYPTTDADTDIDTNQPHNQYDPHIFKSLHLWVRDACASEGIVC